MKKKIVYVGIFIFLLLILLEVSLRLFGLGDAVLLQEDSDFEYIAQPNQHRVRLGNHIIYNSKSMRSDEVDTSAIIILGFGDSILNGGSYTDHDSLATTILSDSLSKLYNKKIQFLNISAGSWGPDNAFAYLKKYGDFGAKAIFLFVSSHDAYDEMAFGKVVNNHVDYPAKQYPLAIFELIYRYILPSINYKYTYRNYSSNTPSSPSSESEIEHKLLINKKKDKNASFNPGFYQFLTYTQNKNIPFIIYLHANIIELNSKSYNKYGKEIIAFANNNHIPLIMDIRNGLEPSDFRDIIHLNNKGQKKMAKIIIQYFLNNKNPELTQAVSQKEHP